MAPEEFKLHSGVCPQGRFERLFGDQGMTPRFGGSFLDRQPPSRMDLSCWGRSITHREQAQNEKGHKSAWEERTQRGFFVGDVCALYGSELHGEEAFEAGHPGARPSGAHQRPGLRPGLRLCAGERLRAPPSGRVWRGLAGLARGGSFLSFLLGKVAGPEKALKLSTLEHGRLPQDGAIFGSLRVRAEVLCLFRAFRLASNWCLFFANSLPNAGSARSSPNKGTCNMVRLLLVSFQPRALSKKTAKCTQVRLVERHTKRNSAILAVRILILTRTYPNPPGRLARGRNPRRCEVHLPGPGEARGRRGAAVAGGVVRGAGEAAAEVPAGEGLGLRLPGAVFGRFLGWRGGRALWTA